MRACVRHLPDVKSVACLVHPPPRVLRHELDINTQRVRTPAAFSVLSIPFESIVCKKKKRGKLNPFLYTRVIMCVVISCVRGGIGCTTGIPSESISGRGPYENELFNLKISIWVLLPQQFVLRKCITNNDNWFWKTTIYMKNRIRLITECTGWVRKRNGESKTMCKKGLGSRTRWKYAVEKNICKGRRQYVGLTWDMHR